MLPTGDFTPRSHGHEVLFYSDDAVYVETATNFLIAALSGGGAAIAFATKRNRDVLYQGLKLQDIDIDAAVEQGAFISLDAAELLSTFMVNGWPDDVRFFAAFRNVIGLASAALKRTTARIAVFGEAAALLCDQGNIEAAIRVEQLGNHLGKKYHVDILCAYPLEFCDTNPQNQIKRICAQHSAIRSRL